MQIAGRKANENCIRFYLGLTLIPLVAALFMLLHAYRDAFHRGRTFAKGLHVFGFMYHSGGSLAITFVLSLLFLSIYFGLRKRHRRIVRSWAVTSIAVSLCLGFCIFPLASAAFEKGRDSAYAAVDLCTLVSDCREVVHRLASARSLPIRMTQVDKDFGLLPVSLRDLGPSEIYVGSQAIIVQMDGGGVAAHEGFYIPLFQLDSSVSEFAKRRAIKVHQIDPPVFRFRLDDYRGLLDAP